MAGIPPGSIDNPAWQGSHQDAFFSINQLSVTVFTASCTFAPWHACACACACACTCNIWALGIVYRGCRLYSLCDGTKVKVESDARFNTMNRPDFWLKLASPGPGWMCMCVHVTFRGCRWFTWCNMAHAVGMPAIVCCTMRILGCTCLVGGCMLCCDDLYEVPCLSGSGVYNNYHQLAQESYVILTSKFRTPPCGGSGWCIFFFC